MSRKPSPRPDGRFDPIATPPAASAPGDGGLLADTPAEHAPALAHLMAADAVLARLIRQVGPCRLEVERRVQPFAALVQAIIYQQLHGKAAAAILQRVRALFPGRRFPRPEEVLAMGEGPLRGAGLSRAKLAAIRDLAEKAQAGVVPTAREIARMPDEGIIERLVAIRGIGPWTVEMLLLFHLGRPDVLPVTDYGVRQGFALAFGRASLPSPGELREHGERWRPHRSVAAWYLWRAVERERNSRKLISC